MRLRTPASRRDCSFFPLSTSIFNSCRTYKTLPPALFQQIQPPFNVAKHLYYPIPIEKEGERNSFQELTIQQIVGQDDPDAVPIELRQEASWKAFTPDDIQHTVGFTDVRLNGFEARAQWQNSLYSRPSWEKTVHDQHAPLGEFLYMRNTTASEEEARKWLEEHQETRFKWGGKFLLLLLLLLLRCVE